MDDGVLVELMREKSVAVGTTRKLSNPADIKIERKIVTPAVQMRIPKTAEGVRTRHVSVIAGRLAPSSSRPIARYPNRV